MSKTYEYYCVKIGFDPLKDSNKIMPAENNPHVIDDRPSPFSIALDVLDYDELTEFESLYKERLNKEEN